MEKYRNPQATEGESICLHTDTLSWFRANQSLLLLINDRCLAKKQITNFMSLQQYIFKLH